MRPVVIISDNEHNSLNEDIICCAITSNPREYHQSVAIKEEDIESGSLNYESRIKPTKIFTLDQSIILKRIARLNILKSKEVVAHLNKSIRIE
jgi:mRNA interferase MazF